MPQLQCNYCKVINPFVKWRPKYGCYLCTTHANHAGRIKSGKCNNMTLKQFLADCIKAEMERQKKREMLDSAVSAPGEAFKAQLKAQNEAELERKQKNAERMRIKRAEQKNPPPIF